MKTAWLRVQNLLNVFFCNFAFTPSLRYLVNQNTVQKSIFLKTCLISIFEHMRNRLNYEIFFILITNYSVKFKTEKFLFNHVGYFELQKAKIYF